MNTGMLWYSQISAGRELEMKGSATMKHTVRSVRVPGMTISGVSDDRSDYGSVQVCRRCFGPHFCWSHFVHDPQAQWSHCSDPSSRPPLQHPLHWQMPWPGWFWHAKACWKSPRVCSTEQHCISQVCRQRHFIQSFGWHCWLIDLSSSPLAKRLAGKNVSKSTYFASSET